MIQRWPSGDLGCPSPSSRYSESYEAAWMPPSRPYHQILPQSRIDPDYTIRQKKLQKFCIRWWSLPWTPINDMCCQEKGCLYTCIRICVCLCTYICIHIHMPVYKGTLQIHLDSMTSLEIQAEEVRMFGFLSSRRCQSSDSEKFIPNCPHLFGSEFRKHDFRWQFTWQEFG